MKVLKFGGTSLGSPDNIKKVKAIVTEKSKNSRVVVVASAFSGVTNQLQECSHLAEKGDDQYKTELDKLINRHLEAVQSLLGAKSQSPLMAKVRLVLNEIEDILKGVFLIHELSIKTLDRILGSGEVLSALIINEFFLQEGMKSNLLDPQDFIITDSEFGKANVDMPLTEKKISSYFQHQEAEVLVCPGFVSKDLQGNNTTLGRGGSDYTAALIAAALDAPELEIWTDVNGMMTANPKYVKQAFAIPQINYEEAMELTHFGAKVLYPPSVHPVYKKGIPIYIKNTFEPEAEGTKIHKFPEADSQSIKGISCIENIALFNLSGSSMVGIPYFSHRLFEALAQAKVSVILITQASSEHSICVAIDLEDVKRAKLAIEKAFSFEFKQEMLDPLFIETDLAIVALVSSQLKNQIGLSGKMFSVLGQNGINIKAIAQGSSEKNISAVIDKKQIKKALNTLHESFFLSDLKRVNLFIVGTGNVGKTLIDQLNQQSDYLKDHSQIDLRISGIANSRKMLFDLNGIPFENAVNTLLEKGQKMNLEQFLEDMKDLNLRNSIFIDNTAHEVVANTYSDVLASSISVVTPNKIACTGKYDDYKNLKNLALRYRSHFRFETNVGAGLPVINTLDDLIKSGDEILGIQAVLSGSLNFIFNNYTGEGDSFAEVVKQAQEEGYTEPDPRIDLSGVDVKRKILILLRESGFEMELDDIDTIPFIPEKCMQAENVEQFFESIAQEEAHFKKLVEEANAEGKKLKYVATFENGKANTGLEKIASDRPLYNLEGKDNIVLFNTKRYPEQPLVIKGAGAGAAVTASGIFGDIIRIANAL
ncbi:bifunctional aspartate kinase/homoserine dehydrogenase I [Marivirga salinae]|uniref:Bifunctional aspartate kinase/homoserine dehydrogenase I n=1 Tax=Marivirga salinarum TaxID=3059078 RepID=A0AA49GCH5_9BACT|nr:bifunctional aspartate kinase/homoserine dehydrogenase I [Marivirga sp. BDSF4-3]WKK76057.2 bifunctional aspartate kinase/homoserine dehydrogenase I [Marivirga sp. BDSF4-3]